MSNDQLADALAGATVEMLREDAAALLPWARAMSSEMSPRFYRFAALALAVAKMQEGSVNAIPQNPERPHVIFWSVDECGMADWINGDVGDNAERSLPAALAALLREAK